MGFVFDRTPASALTDNERLYSCTDDSDCNVLSFTAVICDPTEYPDEWAEEGDWGLYNACKDDYFAGNMDSFIVGPERTVSAGQYLLVVPSVSPSSVTGNKPITLKATISWSTNSFVFVADEDDYSYAEEIPKSTLPTTTYKNGKKTETASWQDSSVTHPEDSTETVAYERFGNQWVSFYIAAGSWATDVANNLALSSETEFGTFFLQAINEGGGQGEIFYVNDNPEYTAVAGTTDAVNADGVSVKLKKISPVSTTIDFGGQSASDDATLSSLYVKNTSETVTYPLDPAFSQSALPQAVFSTKVPSATGEVKIIATAHDNAAQNMKIFDGNVENTASGGDSMLPAVPSTPIVGTGTKSLNPGHNYYTIAVTSENGNIQNEVVDVYQLSSDATPQESYGNWPELHECLYARYGLDYGELYN